MKLRALLFFLLGYAAVTSVAAAEHHGPYRATVVKVIDGDTVLLDVAIWPGLVQRVSLRLAGVNTPEKRGRGISDCEKKAGQAATTFTQRFLKDAGQVVISEVRLGKYAGRALGRLSSKGKDLGEALIQAGHAMRYDGGTRTAWCR